MHNYAPMLTIWQGHCALRTPLPLGACGTYVHFVLYTLLVPSGAYADASQNVGIYVIKNA